MVEVNSLVFPNCLMMHVFIHPKCKWNILFMFRLQIVLSVFNFLFKYIHKNVSFYCVHNRDYNNCACTEYY